MHTCPGGDQDSTHSADVDYADLLPDLFNLRAGRFYIQLASEPNRQRVLGLIREQAKPEELIYVGVTDPIDPNVESPEQVRDRVLEAAEYIPVDRLGTTDDCGFAPFGDDISTARDTAFQKIPVLLEPIWLPDISASPKGQQRGRTQPAQGRHRTEPQGGGGLN